MTQHDKEELALYRKIAEINGRLEALRAVEAIAKDVVKRVADDAARSS
jgi:hypothetical protein